MPATKKLKENNHNILKTGFFFCRENLNKKELLEKKNCALFVL